MSLNYKLRNISGTDITFGTINIGLEGEYEFVTDDLYNGSAIIANSTQFKELSKLALAGNLELVINSDNQTRDETLKFIHKYNQDPFHIVSRIVGDGGLTTKDTDEGNLADLGRAHTASGFIPDATDCTLSFDEATRTFTIAPVATTFEFWSDDKQFFSTAKSIVLPNTTSRYYIYLDGSGNLQSADWWNKDFVMKYALASIIYWNSSQNKAIKFDDERHQFTRNKDWHLWSHTTIGTMLGGDPDQGYSLTGTNPNGNGSAEDMVEFTIGKGYVKDEEIYVPSKTPTPSSDIPLLYRQGDGNGDNAWYIESGLNSPIKTDGTRATFNSFDGQDWEQNTVADGNFFLIHIVASTGYDKQVFAIQGIKSYASILEGKANANEEIAEILHADLPTIELVAVHSIGVMANSAFTNSKHSIIIADYKGRSSFDWRKHNLNPIDHSIDEFEAFDGLIDTPNSKFGMHGKMVVVSTDEQTLEYVDVPGTGTGGRVDTLVAGTGIAIDNTDDVNPKISVTGTVGGSYVAEYCRIILSSSAMGIKYISTPYTCPFNTIDINSNSASYALESNGIKVLKAGRYRINAETTLDSSGEARADPKMDITINDALAVSSTGKRLGTWSHYARHSGGSDASSATLDLTLDLSANDVVKIQLSKGGNTGDVALDLTADYTFLELTEVIASTSGGLSSVSTDATLTGDGTSGDPLKVVSSQQHETKSFTLLDPQDGDDFVMFIADEDITIQSVRHSSSDSCNFKIISVGGTQSYTAVQSPSNEAVALTYAENKQVGIEIETTMPTGSYLSVTVKYTKQ